MNKPQKAWVLLKETVTEWIEDKVPRLGAALAFYSILSMAPLLVIVVAIAAFAFGEEAAQGRIVKQLDDLVGSDGAKAVETMIKNSQQPRTGIVATVIGIATLLIGAAGVFGQLQDALNTVWEVQPKPGRGFWGFIHDRFLSMAMVLGVGFLLLVSLVLSAGLSALGDYLNSLVNGLAPIMQVVNMVLSFGVFTALFGLIFKILPDVKIPWRNVWIGAAITALLFTIGKYLIGLYLGRSSVGSAYGAAGSLVVLVVWIYYSAQIVLFGAEFTQVYTKHYGPHPEPSECAEAIPEIARARQGLSRAEVHAH
jgi:membrane protein